MAVLMQFEASGESLEKQDKCLIAKIKSQELTGDECWNTEVDDNGNVNVIVKHFVRYAILHSASTQYVMIV